MPQVGVLQSVAKAGKPSAATDTQAQRRRTSPRAGSTSARGRQAVRRLFKAANKSTVWYNTKVFDDAGRERAQDLGRLPEAAKTICRLRRRPVSSAAPTAGRSPTGSRTSTSPRPGPEKYDQLAKHEIKWTDPSVKEALTTLATAVEREDLIAGGTRGALQHGVPDSVTQVFADPPKAAMVYRGRLRGGEHRRGQAKVGTDAKVFHVPGGRRLRPAVVSGGDAAVALKLQGAQALVTFLASRTPRRSGPSWAVSPRRTRAWTSGYPDDTSRQIAKALSRRRRLPLRHVRPGTGALAVRRATANGRTCRTS